MPTPSCIGVLDGEKIHHDVDGVLSGLVAAGEAKAKHRHLAVAHAGGKRWILVGLGTRDELDGERVRLAAASALGRARELGARRLCWEAPHKVGPEIAAAIVEGTLLTAYRFDRFKSKPADENAGVEALVVCAHDDLTDVVARGRDRRPRGQRGARPAEHAGQRDDADPRRRRGARARRARRRHGRGRGPRGPRAARHGLVRLRRAGLGTRSPRSSRCSTRGRTRRGPVLGLVGKAVTFDSGGISIKPANKMSEMKFDMSGGAAVLGAIEAIASCGCRSRRRGRRRDGEHAVRQRGQAGRRRHRRQRHDDRDHQHRRRGPARARRLPDARRQPGRRAARRHRDADRLDHHRAGQHVRRAVRVRRRLGGAGDRRRRRRPARSSGACRCTPTTPRRSTATRPTS